MPSYNRVVLVGHVTRDSELKKAGATSVLEFGLAAGDSYKDKNTGEWKEVPMFVDIKLFGPYAERIGSDIHKGNLVLVEGKLRFDQWQDKQTGAKRSRHYVNADMVRHLTNKAAREAAASSPSPYSGPSTVRPEAVLDEESVPF